jgi:predicted ATPase
VVSPRALPFRAPRTSFVGRSAELQAVRDLVDRHRLVTILGPPGCGKTRLATELALRDLPAGASGVWLCCFEDARSIEDFDRQVSAAFGVPLLAGQEPADLLGNAIAARGPLLLLLDAAEHVAEIAAGRIAWWLDAAPEARFVATSQRRLGVEGEVLFDLGPLSLPRPGEPPAASEAVQLFAERARVLRSGRPLRDDEMAAAAELVKALDGLPLAIETAAARTRVLGVRQLVEDAERARASYRDGASGAKTALRIAIHAAWQRLRPCQQSALAQCSVFTGSFSAQEAQEVIELPEGAASPPVAEVLLSLRDESLLSLDEPPELPGEGRLSMLASVRELAAERLWESGLARAALARHARSHVRAAVRWRKELDGEDALLARTRLRLLADQLAGIEQRCAQADLPEQETAMLVLQAALALDPVLSIEGPWSLRVGLLGAAIRRSSAPGVPPLLEVEARVAHAEALRDAGVLSDATDEARLAVALADRLADAAWRGRARCALAAALGASGRFDEARSELQTAREVSADRWVQARALHVLGWMAFVTGDLDAAHERYAEALAAARTLGSGALECRIRNGLACVQQHAGRPAAARAHHDEAIRIARKLRDRQTEANSVANTGECLREEGRIAEALDAYGAAISILRDMGNRRDEAIVLCHRARARAGALDFEAARDDIERARDASSGIADLHCTVTVEVWGEVVTLLAERARAADPERLAAARRAAELHLRSILGEQGRDVLRSGVVARAVAALRSLLDAGELPARASARVLKIGAGGRWFEWEGSVVRLHRRHALRALLERLALERRAHADQALTVQTLFEAGWPGERAAGPSAANRVHNALSTLRAMGLRDVLQRREDGYLLTANVEIASD